MKHNRFAEILDGLIGICAALSLLAALCFAAWLVMEAIQNV